MAQKTKKQSSWDIVKHWLKIENSFPFILVFFGIVGLLASSILVFEKIELLRNPDEALVCDINPIYSCSSVSNSEQSEILGFPNELLGIPVFSAIITVGALMIGGVKMKPWVWKYFMLGMAGGMLFVAWFFYQSVYVIGALCLFCSSVWFSLWAITMSGYAWIYDQKIFSYKGFPAKIARIKREYAFTIWFLFIVLLVTLIVKHFWFYYGTKFGF